MKKYSYPAVFSPEENGLFSVSFPDIEGCYTCGDSLADAIIMAEDALAFCLYDYERNNVEVPVPSPAYSIHLVDNQFINYIACDTLAYRKKNNSKCIKKTLTIPEWINEEALALGLNFSQVLQEALLQIISQK